MPRFWIFLRLIIGLPFTVPVDTPLSLVFISLLLPVSKPIFRLLLLPFSLIVILLTVRPWLPPKFWLFFQPLQALLFRLRSRPKHVLVSQRQFAMLFQIRLWRQHLTFFMLIISRHSLQQFITPFLISSVLPLTRHLRLRLWTCGELIIGKLCPLSPLLRFEIS